MKLLAAVLTGTALILVSACASIPAMPTAAEPAVQPDAALDALSERMVAMLVGYDPTSAYFIGVRPPDHRRWADRSIEARAAFQRQTDELLTELRAIPAGQLTGHRRFTHAAMVERLEADRQSRICRSELWDVNHMGGWHLELAEVAREQPVGTADERAQALERWSSLPAVIDQEIANLRLGLEGGYSAPKPVVRRVIRQIEGLVSAEPESLPFFAIATRTEDPAFRSAFRAVLAGPVNAAFRRYREFLQNEYLPRARDELGVSANPDGRECYAASLRGYTTLTRSPEEVFRLGQQTVTGNLARVRELGRSTFGTDDIAAIVPRISQAPDNRFGSEEELIRFSRDAVARAREKSIPLFLAMPAQEMRVEPFHAYRRGSGGSSYYERQIDAAQPAFYRINSESWATETRGGAEITAVHEGYPGHHMQISFAQSTAASPASAMLGNSAYIEGWARYSEALAEEAGIYDTVYALMTRRLWPARGMVLDPGIHVMGWTREQAIDFMRESGRFGGTDADDLVDRIAILPGQLAAYDSGGLEIMALRREAEAALGERFDLREFHARVLETGAVPLSALRAHVTRWLAAERRPAQ
jgi:uncharacterized protein (DUF885 family)